MTTPQEVAHIVVGLMTAFGAILLVSFVVLRPNFGKPMRMALLLLAVGLAAIGAFSIAEVFRPEGWLLDAISILAVIGAAVAAIASAMLAQTAFQSHLLSALHHRVEAHRRTLNRLRRSRDELETRVIERTREVHEQEKRLRLALRDSNISVFMQDADLRYVWMRNAPEGFNAHEVIGKVDEEILPATAARVASKAKRQVIETGEDVTFEACIEPQEVGGRMRYFEVTTEPYYDAAGKLSGLLSVSVETTETREREELLKATLREVSHRTKNQLAILMSIARRLAINKPETVMFLPAFEARMRALSICQDVLIENDWAVAPLESLVRAQLAPYLSRGSRPNSAVAIKGPDVGIIPTSVQNLGLIIHELALNAKDSGALDAATGPIEISWKLLAPSNDSEEDEEDRRLVFYWKEPGAELPPSDRFWHGFGFPMARKLAASGLGGSLKVEGDETHHGITAQLEIGRSAFAA